MGTCLSLQLQLQSTLLCRVVRPEQGQLTLKPHTLTLQLSLCVSGLRAKAPPPTSPTATRTRCVKVRECKHVSSGNESRVPPRRTCPRTRDWADAAEASSRRALSSASEYAASSVRFSWIKDWFRWSNI
jgi:hypothetical protein